MCVLDDTNTWSLIRPGYESFFWVGRGGVRESIRSRSTGSVFDGRHTFLNSPIFLCYILYIDQLGFLCIKFHRIVKSTLDLDNLDRHTLFKSRQLDDLFHTLKTVKGLLYLVPSRTPRSSGYGFST
jgi:hypothetical protein